MMLQPGLKLSKGVQALESPRKCRLRSAVTCALPRATRHELQSNLHMAPTCAGFRDAQKRPYCEPRLNAANA